MRKFLMYILNLCKYFIPVLAFFLLYQKPIKFIPFIRVDYTSAYIFCGLLFLAAVFLSLKKWIGLIVSFVSCLFAVIITYMNRINIKYVLITSAIIFLYHMILFFMDSTSNKNYNNN